jgi:hypothetical protein
MNGLGRVTVFGGGKNFTKYSKAGKQLLPGAKMEYYGNLKDDKFDGKGELLTNTGIWYVGEFKNNLRHGKGVQYLPCNSQEDLFGQKFSRYEGEFR